MEAQLAQERFLEQHVHQLLRDNDQPIGNVLQAFESYRAVCQDIMLSDLERATETEMHLWQAHTAGKAYFHNALSNLRKRGNEVVVQTRGLIKLYLKFLKDSERFYRGYIYRLHTQFGGIAELEAVAQRMSGPGDGAKSGESLRHDILPELRQQALASCHRSLIYLGDLSRYRASDKLDKNPDFGRAIGYYELACTLRPTSGLGHHQQAVVALAQGRHNELRAIYHLYRALVVDEPHELAAKNLELQLEKANRAWLNGESLHQGATNDVDSAKRLVIGWFVRMHSLCFKGEKSPAYMELEQTLLSQLNGAIKNVTINVEKMLFRMVLVNMAAQHHAGDMVQKSSAIRYQQAFFYFFRLNVRFYTILLDLLHDSIHAVSTELNEDDLTARLTPITCRVLPSLRLYSAWLLSNLHMINGLTNEEFLNDAVTSFWQSYTRVLNRVADKDFFGVWGLDDYEPGYMLTEDCDTLGFKPLQNPHQQSWRNWLLKDNRSLKPRSSDVNVMLMSSNQEMLARMKNLLDDGMYLCHEDKNAPISLVGVRVYYGKPPEEAIQAAEEAKKHPPKAFPKPKPLSYAKVASTGPTQQADQTLRSNRPASANANNRTAQLSRMVDELVDDEDYDNPVTPPQQSVLDPAVVTNGDINLDSMNSTKYKVHQDFAPVNTHQPTRIPKPTGPQASYNTHMTASPAFGTSRDNLASSSFDRLRSESVSGLWHDGPALSNSPNLPPGPSMGTLNSPSYMRYHCHSRVNSASSIRSVSSAQNATYGDTWTSLEAMPQPVRTLHVPALAREESLHGYMKFGVSGMASPLLFGAGGGMWSATGGSLHNVTPPNGQGRQEKPCG
ncbi:hypothetical protein M433DRAFT_532297 [Acidomyces richmondensis BFW]|nr:MAG: hypothetical protein FE78DRAFT_30140 [Acidomyces sp. 'richmondensis']KYG46860.1 hypothetical protein M433DRAFT_532297 [Acidomyces richmondensis BFW]